MIYKILISIICFQSLSNSACCEFDKDCFTIFARSLYSRGILRKEAKTHYVLSNISEFKNGFVKSVKLEEKSLCFKMSKSTEHEDILKIISITKPEPQKIYVKFSSKHSGVTYEGTVTLGFKDDKPIFLDIFFTSQIE